MAVEIVLFNLYMEWNDVNWHNVTVTFIVAIKKVLVHLYKINTDCLYYNIVDGYLVHSALPLKIMHDSIYLI